MKFKKIMSVLASAVMLSSTIGFAAAASYPEPFVAGGTADSAVIVGGSAAVSDWAAAIDLQKNLQGLVTSSSTTIDDATTGETAELFTSSTKIYINDTLNAVKSVLTDTDLPIILKDGSFSGNVDASYTQTIELGSWPQITFEKQPTSSDDPIAGLKTSTTVGFRAVATPGFTPAAATPLCGTRTKCFCVRTTISLTRVYRGLCRDRWATTTGTVTRRTFSVSNGRMRRLAANPIGRQNAV